MFAYRDIPKSALFLGLVGVLPFLWGTITFFYLPAMQFTLEHLSPRFAGPFVGLDYGRIILAFMSGVLWGFSTRSKDGQAATGYALSVIPALWGFFMVGGNSGGEIDVMNLLFGFIGLLGLDYAFWSWGLAPRWWMALRILLTACVIACFLPMIL